MFSVWILTFIPLFFAEAGMLVTLLIVSLPSKYYIDSGYCILLAEAVILVEAVGRDQYYLLRPIKYNIG